MSLSGPYILQVNETVNNATIAQPNQTFRIVRVLDGTNAALVKNAGGCVAYVEGTSVVGSLCYLKLYNQATVPNVGIDVPFYTKFIAPKSDFTVNFGGSPLIFSNGIALALTALPDDNDASPVTAGDVMGINLVYC